jgi:predicted nucleic acid-binding protein
MTFCKSGAHVAFLIDTSALIHVLRDKTGRASAKYDTLVGVESVHLSRVTAYELLKGARNQTEWIGLEQMLATQSVFECSVAIWTEAARIVSDMRRSGLTLKNPIDALIAQTAIERTLTIVHDDQDFELIARLRPLQLQHFRP